MKTIGVEVYYHIGFGRIFTLVGMVEYFFSRVGVFKDS